MKNIYLTLHRPNCIASVTMKVTVNIGKDKHSVGTVKELREQIVTEIEQHLNKLEKNNG